ncbi:MAG: 16S rRNA (uracil1498-N3)-methyltransferase [Bacteroidia bacterium]|jgi:16S rRNA (uracil1498-N3)-methyltransferase
MRNTRIYTSTALHSGADFVLEPEPSRHLSRSLRLGEGDALTLFDGSGGEYSASIMDVGKKHVTVRTGQHQNIDRESALAIHLGIAVSRGDRFDWVIQKATELGATSISPLQTERTGVRLSGERAEKKLSHWRQIAISACEQCGRNRLPALNPLQSLQSWIDATQADQRLVLHHRAAANLETTEQPGSIALLVGPEGGLSEAEIEQAQRSGYFSLTLGPRIMRTETAPLAALAILQSRWGDMAPR